MNNVFINPKMSENATFKIAKLEKQNQKFTYVAELECSHDEKWLAAMWACVAPTQKYSTKEFKENYFPLTTPDD